MKKFFVYLLLLSSSLAFTYCENQNQSPEDEEYVVVPPGKADNFLSNSAQEYAVYGTYTIELKSEYANKTEEERLERVKRLIPVKQIQIGWFLNQYVQEKSEHDSNKDYGGFQALTKNGSYEELEITKVDDLHYSFKFRQEIGGSLDLLSKLPVTTDENGKMHFKLIIGKVDNDTLFELETNYEWYRRSPWSDFDPSKVSEDKKEELDLIIEPEDRSYDAWIDYNRLFEDGEVTIAVHFGWDYHNNYHLKHSEEIYNWLVHSLGFKSPVEKYEDYTRTSGPLTRTITANGKEVVVKIWLFWGKPGTDTDPDTYQGGIQLEKDMRESFKTKEVIVFSGHSGPFYGFALANWRKTDEGDLDDSEIPFLEMPDDTYQIVFAEGCDTYALGMGFRLNPHKENCKNIDILTTTSFSNAGTADSVKDFIRAILGTNYSISKHKPKKYSTLLDDLDHNSWWFTTMYGVHCIDDNPHLHPYADTSFFCQECHNNSDCGAEGNICIKLEAGKKVCSAPCTADDGCPEGYKCMDVAQGSWITNKACVPAEMSCENITQTPKFTVIINEVLADPPDDEEFGDTNGDGERNPWQDEFIEIYNVTGDVIDISGYEIADGVGTRFVFPEGTKLLPGRAAVVFGGGDPSQFNKDFGGSIVFAATQLGFNNKGDSVSLYDNQGNLLDKLEYGKEGNKGISMVRKVDGDPNSPFVLHTEVNPDLPCSPGMNAEGVHF